MNLGTKYMAFRKIRMTQGFTLLEVVVAMAILITVLMICYQILASTLDASERIDRSTRPDKIGEGIMALIKRDLQGAVWFGLGDLVFIGENIGDGETGHDQVHFFTSIKPL